MRREDKQIQDLVDYPVENQEIELKIMARFKG